MVVVHFMLYRGLFFHPVELAYAPSLFGPLAQSVEQLAFNQLVAGSNPARPTIYQPPSGGFLLRVLWFLTVQYCLELGKVTLCLPGIVFQVFCGFFGNLVRQHS